jgi:hypothetical protein
MEISLGTACVYYSKNLYGSTNSTKFMNMLHELFCLIYCRNVQCCNAFYGVFVWEEDGPYI